MELEKCHYDAIGENICCCKSEPFDGSENLQFKPVIENYDDYLNNKHFIESKRKEYEDSYTFYLRQKDENLKMLKNLFLNEFINSEKQIKGICINETKTKKNPFYHIYLYIVDMNKNGIVNDGILVPVILIRFQEKNGELTNIALSQDASYFVDYETLCSCRITEQEFMNVYNRANNKIMEQLEVNKVDSK